jgi:hypothetical protein
MGQERFCHFCKENFDAGRVDGYGFTPVVHSKCGHISTCEGDLGVFEETANGGKVVWRGEAAKKYLERVNEFPFRP